MTEHQSPESHALNLRLQIIRRIWGAMPAILALCIPIEAVTKAHGAVAITALLAAGISTVAVWFRDNGTAAPTRLKEDNSATEKRLQELEERLANLESITNFEHKLLDAKYRNAAPVAPTENQSLTSTGGAMTDSPIAPAAPKARPIAPSG